MSDIITWSATQTAQNIADKSISITEVTEAHITHAQTVDARLNCLTQDTFDIARDQAKSLDENHPDTLPSGFGLPITIKSNIDQIGVPNSNGIPALANNICDRDSAVTANLRKSGAVMLGRTNTPEFSLRWCTSNPLHGVSLNPWDNTKTPGGSSGAAAAAVAAGLGVIAHGNDLGGSLRYPAFCCGVVSIRPSFGRIPNYNPCAPAERPSIGALMSVNGPIARSVADTRLGLQMMAQPDPRDPNNIPNPASGRTHIDTPKIGITTDPFGDGVDPEIAKSVQIAAAALRDLGFPVTEIDPPSATRTAELWGELLFTEAKHTAAPLIEQHGSPEMNTLFTNYSASFRELDTPGLIAALSERITLQRQWAQMFEGIDILVMPTSGIPPFENDLDLTSPESLPKILNAQKFLYATNVLGLPSVALPTHLAGTVPVGVQLVAPMHEDFFALNIAEKLENQLGRLITKIP